MKRILLLFLVLISIGNFISCSDDDNDYVIKTVTIKDSSDPNNLGEEPKDTTINELLEMETIGTIAEWMIRSQTREDANEYYQNEMLDTKGNWEMLWYNNKVYEPLSVGGIISKHKYIPNTFSFASSGIVINSEQADLIIADIFSYGELNGKNIAKGAETAFNNIKSLTDKGYQSETEVDFVTFFVDYIKENPEKNLPITIYLPGVSQAGSMALLTSADLYEEFKTQLSGIDLKANDIILKVYAFNSPNYITQEFADYYNSLPRFKDGSDESIKVFFEEYTVDLDQVSAKFANNFQAKTTDITYPMTQELRDLLDIAYEAIYDLEQLENVSYVSMQDAINGNHHVLTGNFQPKSNFNVPDTLKTFSDFEGFVTWYHDHANIIIQTGGKCLPSVPTGTPMCPDGDGPIIPVHRGLVTNYLDLLEENLPE
ncbi:hypothetical protein [Aureivirga marina]|uniref:hypothetical protein n=1 Tax=Aureivirga marina TaxID=1182451 RepID=UPI0018C95234|nr:hypothetical protein [Aureivirga marina]